MTTNTAQPSADVFKNLKAPFPASALEWTLIKFNSKETSALAIPSPTQAAVADRLDEVVGGLNWRNTYVSASAGALVCKLEIRIGDEWLCKEHGASADEVELGDGGFANAFIRAASMFGVGRYLQAESPCNVNLDEFGGIVMPESPETMPSVGSAAAVVAAFDNAPEERLASRTDTATVAVEAPPEVASAPEVAPVVEAEKPTTPAKSAKTRKTDVKADVSPSDDTPAAAAAAVVPAAVGVDAPDASTGIPDIHETEVVISGPADTAPIDTLTDVSQATAKVEKTPEVVEAPSPVTEPATAVVEANAAVDKDASAPAADIVIAFDGEGKPVRPEGFTPRDEKNIAGLLARMEKRSVKLSTIVDYAKNQQSTGVLTAPAIAYVLACVAVEQKVLDAEAAAEAAVSAQV